MVARVIQDAIDRYNGIDPNKAVDPAKSRVIPNRAARRRWRAQTGLIKPKRSRIQRGRSGPSVRGDILTKGMQVDDNGS